MAKIIGGTTATPMRVPDWEQTNPNRSDYIKNKPDLSQYDARISALEETIANFTDVSEVGQ